MKIFQISAGVIPGFPLLSMPAFASEDAAADPASSAVQPGFAYHALDPDIITNYLGDGKTWLCAVTVELMAENAADLKLLEQHDPLIRDAIIRLIGSKTGAQIKSLVSREELRRSARPGSTSCWSERPARRRYASSSSPSTCISNELAEGRTPAAPTRLHSLSRTSSPWATRRCEVAPSRDPHRL